MLRSFAVFIILIKLLASFIHNVGRRVSKKSQVIVVGSHADKWRAIKDQILVTKIDIERIIKDQEYKGFVAVDCRNKDGDEFVNCLSESSKAVVDGSDHKFHDL